MNLLTYIVLIYMCRLVYILVHFHACFCEFLLLNTSLVSSSHPDSNGASPVLIHGKIAKLRVNSCGFPYSHTFLPST